jgi:sugar O-acyltransferase (sialic acid O-acetyltransferase NeuD family)
MSKPQLLLIGAGGHARACIDVIEQQGVYQIAGLVGSQSEINAKCFGYSVIATDNDLVELRKDYDYAFVAVGQIKTPESRIEIYRKLVQLDFKLPIIVSPRAYVSKFSSLNSGTIVMHDALINAGAIVGQNCIINTKALIEHDVVVEDHCHISTGAIINGAAVVKTGTFVGSNAVTKQEVHTKEFDFIKAGSVFKGYLNE